MTSTPSIRATYWASARAAAGCATDEVAVAESITLNELRTRLGALHPDTRLPAVLAGCSVLVGEQPVSSRDPDDVLIEPGSAVDFLPPFAGG